MLTLAINDDNDLYLSGGNITVAKDINALGNIYINKAQTVKGEVVYNTDKGIDFFNTVFCFPLYLDVFQYQLVNELTDTEKTKSVKNYKQTIENDTLNYSVTCNTEYGDIILNG